MIVEDKTILLYPKDLLAETTYGTCRLWNILYEMVPHDDNQSHLIINNDVTIGDVDHYSEWTDEIVTLDMDGIHFNGDVLINTHFAPIKYIEISNVIATKCFEIYGNIPEVICTESKFTEFHITGDSQKVNINTCEFNGEFVVHQNLLKDSKLINCTFKDKLSVGNGYCSVFETVSFENSVFDGKAHFKGATLTDCNFSQTEFHQKIDFRHATLKNNTFHWTEFYNQGAFHGVTFQNNPNFHNLILKDTSHLYFENLNPQNTDLSIEKFSLTNTVINGRVDFSENIISCLDLKDSIILGTLTRRNFNPDCANWETATLLKNEELKQNNLIRALKYKAIEKDLYMKWLKYTTVYFKWCRKCGHIVDLKSKNKIKKLYDKLYKIQQKYQIPEDTIIIDEDISLCKLRSDRLSLRLSWAFNDHGQSWLRGIFVTLGVWFVCFGMFYLPSLLIAFHDKNYLMLLWDTLNSNVFFENLLDYLNPTNYESLKKYFISKTLCMRISETIGMIWFLLGKALVPYGIFEVVQAFRKYNKID